MSVAGKLQIRPTHRVCVLHLPDAVELDLPPEVAMTEDPAEATAVVLFASDRRELRERAGPLIDAARRDALAWIAYPKARQLGTDLTRDNLWESLQAQDIKPVRQVAIDAVWSGLRFRPA
ncbi:MAG: hypothetical protein EA340_08040 [Nitriliruptor sp.]|nr:MAG: hypothetical protein EA340_08040 [Nitriliruptor sp.]